MQPLVPIGCAATAYFLASGIKSFRDRDPVRSQRMMKYRVAAQFVTLMCFVGYIGWERYVFSYLLMICIVRDRATMDPESRHARN